MREEDLYMVCRSSFLFQKVEENYGIEEAINAVFI